MPLRHRAFGILGNRCGRCHKRNGQHGMLFAD
jgi:hypothetical protein